MFQHFKSTMLVAVLASTSVFHSAFAAVPHAPLPFMKTINVSPQGFSVDLIHDEKTETVRFSIHNFTGRRLRCTLKGPDGTILETVYLKNRNGETLRNYLFDSADEGTYKLEVADGREKIVKTISLSRISSVAQTRLSIQ